MCVCIFTLCVCPVVRRPCLGLMCSPRILPAFLMCGRFLISLSMTCVHPSTHSPNPTHTEQGAVGYWRAWCLLWEWLRGAKTGEDATALPSDTTDAAAAETAEAAVGAGLGGGSGDEKGKGKGPALRAGAVVPLLPRPPMGSLEGKEGEEADGGGARWEPMGGGGGDDDDSDCIDVEMTDDDEEEGDWKGSGKVRFMCVLCCV